MGKRIKLRDRTKANDIKYSGFLSYRHLRIIGWITLVLAQIAVLFKMTMQINPSTVDIYTPAYNFFNFFNGLSVPLFLIANFAAIAQKKGDWKRLLLFYGGMALMMYVVANLVIIHYAYGFLNALAPYDLYQATKLFGALLAASGSSGYTLNIFIDLFLCTLIFFFLNYKPVKHFQGKKIILLRLLVILPLLYELGGMAVKLFVTLMELVVPTFVVFLLPSKPPLIFIAFFVTFLIMKLGEVRRLKKHQSSEEDLQEYLNTNAHSLLTSIHMAIVFAICVVVDLVCFLLFGALIARPYVEYVGEVEALRYGLSTALTVGFGVSMTLIVCIPIVLLFSYKKTHKNPKLDTFIPIAGIGLIIFVYIEGMFQVVVNNLDYIKYKIASKISGGGEEPAPDPEAQPLMIAIKNVMFKIASKVDAWITM